MLEAVEQQVGRVTRVLALASATCLLGVALLTMADVLLRWLFKAPIRGLMDLTALSCAVIVAAYLPALLARRGNVTIRAFGGVGTGLIGRTCDAFGALVTAVFFALMTWKYIEYSAEMTSANEATVILRWLTGPWWWVVTVMIGVTTVVAVVVLARDLAGRSSSNAASPDHADSPHASSTH